MSDLENSQNLPKEAEFVGETKEENPPIPYEAEPSTSKKSPKDEVDSKLGVEAEHVEIPFEDPPEFSQYEAEFTVSDSGNILSHDHHLNEDGMQICVVHLTLQVKHYIASFFNMLLKDPTFWSTFMAITTKLGLVQSDLRIRMAEQSHVQSGTLLRLPTFNSAST